MKYKKPKIKLFLIKIKAYANFFTKNQVNRKFNKQKKI